MNLPLQIPTSFDLQQACRSGAIADLEACLAQKGALALINERDDTIGWTPLYRTVLSGDHRAVKCLIDNGADPDLPSKGGKTPLHIAADKSKKRIVEVLLAHKADPNRRVEESGKTALHFAAQNGDSRVLEIILKDERTDANVQDMIGQTALHIAVDLCFPECVSCLLSHGADALMKDKFGQSAVDIAEEQSPEITELLKNSGVSVAGHPSARCKSVAPPLSTVNKRAPISFDEFLKNKNKRGCSLSAGRSLKKSKAELMEIDSEFRTVFLAPQQFKNESGELLSTIKNRGSSHITTPFSSDIMNTESEGGSHQQTPECEITKHIAEMQEERTPVVVHQPRTSTKELTFKNFQCLRDSKTQEPFKDQRRNSSKILNSDEQLLQDKENRSQNILSPGPFDPTRPSPQLKRQSTMEQKSDQKQRTALQEKEIKPASAFNNDPMRISFGLEASTARKIERVHKPLIPPQYSQSIVVTSTRSEAVSPSPYHRVKPPPATARGERASKHRRLNDSISEKVKECEQFQRHVHELMTIRNKQTLDLLTGHTPRSFEFTDKLNISALDRRVATDFVEMDSQEKISHSFMGYEVSNSLLSSQRSSREDMSKKYPLTGRVGITKPPIRSPYAGFAIIHAPEPERREAVAKQLLRRKSVEKEESAMEAPKVEPEGDNKTEVEEAKQRTVKEEIQKEKESAVKEKKVEEVKTSLISEQKPPRQRQEERKYVSFHSACETSPPGSRDTTIKLKFGGHYRRVNSVSEPGSAGRVNLSSTRYASSFCEEEEKEVMVSSLCAEEGHTEWPTQKKEKKNKKAEELPQAPDSARSIAELLKDVNIRSPQPSSPLCALQSGMKSLREKELSPIRKISYRAPKTSESEVKIKRCRNNTLRLHNTGGGTARGAESKREVLKTSVVELEEEEEEKEEVSASRILFQESSMSRDFIVENYSFQESSFFDSFFLAPDQLGLIKCRLTKSVADHPFEHTSLKTLSPNKMPPSAILISQEGMSGSQCYTSSQYNSGKWQSEGPLTATLRHESQNTELSHIVALFKSARNDIPSTVESMKRLQSARVHKTESSQNVSIESRVQVHKKGSFKKQRTNVAKQKRRAGAPLVPKPRVKKSHRGFSSAHFKQFDSNTGGASSDDSRQDVFEHHSFLENSSLELEKSLVKKKALATHRCKKEVGRGVLQDQSFFEDSLLSLYKADIDDDCNISEEEGGAFCESEQEQQQQEQSLVKGATHVRHNTNSLNDTFMVKRKEAYFESDHVRSSEEVKTQPQLFRRDEGVEQMANTTRPLAGTMEEFLEKRAFEECKESYEAQGTQPVLNTTANEFSTNQAHDESGLSQFVIDSSEEKIPMEGRGLEQLYLTFQDEVNYGGETARQGEERKELVFYSGAENVDTSESAIPEEMHTSEDEEAKERVAELRRAQSEEMERALHLVQYQSVESLELTRGQPLKMKMENLPKLEEALQDKEELRKSMQILEEWLDEIQLGFLAPVLLDGGFDDVQLLVNQMRTNMRIQESMLKRVGVEKPGHRMRILVKLEEEAGFLGADRSQSATPALTPFKDSPRHGRGLSYSMASSHLQQSWVPPRSASPFLYHPPPSTHEMVSAPVANQSSFFECCSRPNIAPALHPLNPQHVSHCLPAQQVPTLRTWLSALKLASLHHSFVVSGYDDLLSLLKQMSSSYPINDEILRRDVGVTKLGHRSRLLSKLHEDSYYYRNGIQLDSYTGMSEVRCSKRVERGHILMKSVSGEGACNCEIF